jgi:uncharacterized oligopeptide transporter (OPT) family protein
VLTIVTTVTAAADFHKINERQEALSRAFSFVIYPASIVEVCLTFIAMLVLILLLVVRPRSVLIPDKCNGGFIYLCTAIFFLFLCAVYSFIVHIVLKSDSPKMSSAACVILRVHLIALICLVLVLRCSSLTPSCRAFFFFF